MNTSTAGFVCLTQFPSKLTLPDKVDWFMYGRPVVQMNNKTRSFAHFGKNTELHWGSSSVEYANLIFPWEAGVAKAYQLQMCSVDKMRTIKPLQNKAMHFMKQNWMSGNIASNKEHREHIRIW